MGERQREKVSGIVLRVSVIFDTRLICPFKVLTDSDSSS